MTSVYDFVDRAVKIANGRYTTHVDLDDLRSELTVYATVNMFRLEKRLETDGEAYVLRAMLGVAKAFNAAEKARLSGYEYGDNAWYSPGGLASLMPLALDPTWDGLTGQSGDDGPHAHAALSEGGTLLAMVMDVRRVLARHKFFGGWDPDTPNGEDNLERLSELLGGAAPFAPWYRRRDRVTA